MQGQILKCLLIGLLLNIGIAFAQTRECRIDWDNEHTLGTAQFVVDDQGTIEFTSYDPGDGLSGISGLINGSSFSLTMSYQVDSVKLFAIGTLEKPLEQIGNIQNHGEGVAITSEPGDAGNNIPSVAPFHLFIECQP